MRDVLWEDIFKFSGSTAASEFCEWVQFGIKMHISLIVSIRSGLTHLHDFACAAGMSFCCLYHRMNLQQNKSSKSKGNFRQASNHCKRVLDAAKLAYANKTKESITSQKLGSWDAWQVANSVLNKGISAIPPISPITPVVFYIW